MQYEYDRLRKFVATAAIALLFTTLLVSCKTKFDHPDKQIFHYNESSGILSLDPAFASGQAAIWPCNQLYNGLVDMDSALQVVPAIAKSWTISDDGKIYTFDNLTTTFEEPVEINMLKTVLTSTIPFAAETPIPSRDAKGGSREFSRMMNFSASER